MTATLTPPEAEPEPEARAQRRGDRVFAGLARGAGLTIMLALAAVFVFLFVEGWNGLNAAEATYRPATTSSATSVRWSSAPSWRR